MTNTQCRVYLVNVQTIGAMSGYGQGNTKAKAIEDALNRARRIDSDAKYDPATGTVRFAGGVNC